MILEVSNLSIFFGKKKNPVKIIDDLSFTLDHGETLGIAGESGSGKSVTAMTIPGLIPSPPLHRVTGSIVYKGREISGFSPKEFRGIRGKEIGFVFQEPMTALNPVLTIGDQISEAVYIHESTGKKAAMDRAVQLLSEVGISAPERRVNCYPHELSGGMRQRAMIAMALSGNPSLLIADEPTTALDVTIQAQILRLLRRLIKERGMSVIFITHDLGVIAEIADSVLVMREGKGVEYSSVEKIFHEPSHPYTRELLDLMPGRGVLGE